MKTAFILNPAAGGKGKEELKRAALKSISIKFPESPVELARSPGEALFIARRLLEEGYECIAAAGGDGTLNSVLQGFFSDDRGTPVRGGAALAVIPIGTGGDFRKTIGIEEDPQAALSLLTGEETSPCDVGIVEYRNFEGKPARRYFLNITSFGLSGLVDRYVQESSKMLGGTLTFYISTIRAMRSWRNAGVEVTIDGHERIKIKSVLVAVANGKFFGGGMKIAPMAEMNDGLFDVVILGNLSLKDFLMHGAKLYGGKIMNHPEVTRRTARKVALSPIDENETMYMDLDGEPLGTIPATVEIIPSAIKIKV